MQVGPCKYEALAIRVPLLEDLLDRVAYSDTLGLYWHRRSLWGITLGQAPAVLVREPVICKLPTVTWQADNSLRHREIAVILVPVHRQAGKMKSVHALRQGLEAVFITLQGRAVAEIISLSDLDHSGE